MSNAHDRSEHGYAEQFESFLASRQGVDPAWLIDLRRKAYAAFVAAGGFPTTRYEEYKYTRVRKAVAPDYTLTAGAADGLDLDALGAADLGPNRLVFVDGQCVEPLCRLDAVPVEATVGTIARTLANSPDAVESPLTSEVIDAALPFACLNTAFFTDGVFISVPRNVRIEAPIHVVNVGTSDAARVSHLRNVVVADTGAEVTVVESHLGAAASGEGVHLCNVATTLHVGDNARVHHAKVTDQGEGNFHFGRTLALLTRDSHADLHDFSLGGTLVRNDANVVLDGQGGHANVDGLYLTRDGQHIDNHTSIDHAVAHCTSAQLYKGILDGRSTAVFNGKVYVRPDAQKTNGEQSNRNLLLDDRAVVNTKPQLEIWADDVRCTHGATIGRLDEDALFYLRSRGVTEREAQALLTYAFGAEVVARVPCEPLRAHLEAWLDNWLPGEITAELHGESLEV